MAEFGRIWQNLSYSLFADLDNLDNLEIEKHK